MDQRRTVGAESLDLLMKQAESRDPIELQREMQKDYLDNLIACVNEFRANHPGDFFVVVITKNEKLMPNVFRNYFTARNSCPTPDYDQAVFKYDSHKEDIIYLWTIPSKDACIHLRDNAMYVHGDEKELLKHVLDFADGSLYRLSKLMNGEELESPLLITT